MEPRYTIKELEEKGLILPLHDLQKGVEYRKRLLKFITRQEPSVVSVEWLEKHIQERQDVFQKIIDEHDRISGSEDAGIVISCSCGECEEAASKYLELEALKFAVRLQAAVGLRVKKEEKK